MPESARRHRRSCCDRHPANFHRGHGLIARDSACAGVREELVFPNPFRVPVDEHDFRRIVVSGVLIDGQLVLRRVSPHLLFLFVVHVADVIDVDAFRRPFLVQRLCDGLERLLPAAVVAHEQDVRKSGGDGAERDLARDGAERVFRHVHASRKTHVAGLPDRITGRCKRHRRVDERISEPLGDPLGDVVREEEVLAERQAGAILFDAAGIVNCGGLAAGDGVTHFGPGEVLDQDGSILRAWCSCSSQDCDDAANELSHDSSETI